MALATISIPSRALCRPMPLTLLLPDQGPPAGVLYLLHGFSDCHETFVHNSDLVRYCAGLPLVVAMPEAGCSFYADSAMGSYWQHITQEIPCWLSDTFRLPKGRERCFVGGISMGGYGAAKWALQQPEQFAQAFLLAPVTDLARIRAQGFDRRKDPAAPEKEELRLSQLFPGPVEGTDSDLYHLLGKTAPEALPGFFVYSGSDDFMLPETCRFVETLRDRGLSVPFQIQPGRHRWETWEAFLRDMVAQIAAQLP